MKKLNKLGKVALIAVLAVALSITACKQSNQSLTVKPVVTINFSLHNEYGSLKATLDGTEISTGTKVAQGKEVIFTAIPNEGYAVKGWSGLTVSPATATEAKLTVKGIADVKVEFIKVEYNKTASGDYFELTGTGVPPFKMKKIPAVTSGTIGRTDQTNNEEHNVRLSEYYLGETEVTQELYEAIMGNNPSCFQRSGKPPETGEVQEKRPVEKVNWYEAVAFCNELTKVVADLGATQCVYYSDAAKTNVYKKTDAVNEKLAYMDMDKKGFRLPTEAEWEWAAQGGSDRQEYAGISDESKLGEYAWYDGSKTHQVAKKKKNSFDLYDMSGNVWEWCWDWYSNKPPTGGDNPTGAASGYSRVYRGGGWRYGASYCVVGYRCNLNPDYRYFNLGFRLAWRP